MNYLVNNETISKLLLILHVKLKNMSLNNKVMYFVRMCGSLGVGAFAECGKRNTLTYTDLMGLIIRTLSYNIKCKFLIT